MDSPSTQSTATDQLIQACLEGDQQAWDAIVHKYWRRVFNVAYKFVGKHDEAEDLSQEVLLKIYKALATFDRRANFQTWVISISRNLCIDHYLSVRKERETIDRNVDAATLSPADAGPTRPAQAGHALASRHVAYRRPCATSQPVWTCRREPSNHELTGDGTSSLGRSSNFNVSRLYRPRHLPPRRRPPLEPRNEHHD